LGDEAGGGITVDLARGALLGDAAVAHHGDAVGHGDGLALVAGHVDEGDAERALQPLQLALHADAQVGVQGTEWFVEKQHVGFHYQCPRQGHALALAAGELIDRPRLETAQPHEVEHLLGAALPILAAETAHLSEEARRKKTSLDWIAGITAFKAVLLEGLEVVFIVIAVGAGRGLLWPASLGALAASALVLLIGALVHRPLSRVPENALKFGVGVMLSAFGVFWTGEGLGVEWPGADLSLFVFAALFLGAGALAAALARASIREVAQ